MNRLPVYAVLLSLAALVIFVPCASAQDNYEIQVYGSETVEPGHTMVELHSNFTIDGSKQYYGSVGPATDFLPIHQQQQQIFPAIDLDLAPQWQVNFGLGVGLTGSTDHLILKGIIGYRFDF